MTYESEDDSRGFNAIVGKTIKSVDATSINTVRIVFDDGTEYNIWAENRHYDIEVIELRQSDD